MKPLTKIRIAPARIPDLNWCADLNEAGLRIYNAQQSIDQQLAAAETRLRAAVRRYEEETGWIRDDAKRVLESVRKDWSREEIAAAKRGLTLIDGEEIPSMVDEEEVTA